MFEGKKVSTISIHMKENVNKVEKVTKRALGIVRTVLFFPCLILTGQPCQ